jgi:uncharacterized protein (UPF0548 family)
MSKKQPESSKENAIKNSISSPKSLLEQGFEPARRFEQLIANWYQMAVKSRVEELYMIREGVNEPLGATSGGSFPTGSPLDLENEATFRENAVLSRPDEFPVDRPWRWSLIWLSILGVFGGLGTAALVWLTSLPPLPDCQQAARLSSDGERLYCAQQAAQSGQLPKIVSGLEMLKQWDEEHPLHTEATRLIDEWSARILVTARQRMEQNDSKGALEAIKHIPKTSKVYPEGQEIVKEWQQQWQRGKEIYAAAQEALKQQNWDEVSVKILALSKFDHEYWSTRQTNALAQQLGVERQARQVLVKAQKLSKSGTYAGIREAITLAQKVTPKTYAAAEARGNLSQWSQTLLTAGLRQWNSGDRGGAVNTLYVLPAPNTATEVQDLVRFGNAYMLVNSTASNWVPSGSQIWNLMEAIAAIKQVKEGSPFYAQAQAHLKDWQSSLKDLVQVKYATMAAGMGQHSTLKLAIDQAKQVPAGHPRRLQAQTLIAFWNQEVERIEDEPYIVRARELAKSGKIPDLKAAIAQARNVQLGRSMRGQAQDWIATWTSQIQVIEDQPILAKAEEFAAQGKLNAAIDQAAKIQEGRALYAEAQSAIWSWRAEQIRIAQIAEDQPILNRARSLAANGSLSAAIDVAAQIGYGRALYYEAQGSIGAWQEQLRPYVPPVVEAEPDGLPSSDSYESEPLIEAEDDILPPIEDSTPYTSSDPVSPALELAPAETHSHPVEEPHAPPIEEPFPAAEPPVIEAMPMEEMLPPQTSIDLPPPVYDAPQSAEPAPSPQASLPSDKFVGYYDARYYGKPSH